LYELARLCFASYFLIHPLTALIGLLYWLTKKGLLFVLKRLCPWCTFPSTEETVENTINGDISVDVLPDVAEGPNENDAADSTDEVLDNQNQSIEDEGTHEESDASDSTEVGHNSDWDEIPSTRSLKDNENEQENSLHPDGHNNENPYLCHHVGEDADGLADGGQTEEATVIDQFKIEEDYADDFIPEDEAELNKTPGEEFSESFEIKSEKVEEDPENAGMEQMEVDNGLTPVDIETSESLSAGFDGMFNSATRARNPSGNIKIHVVSPEGLSSQHNKLLSRNFFFSIFKILIVESGSCHNGMFLAKVFGNLRKANVPTREQPSELDGTTEERDSQEKDDLKFMDVE
jgi:hypothetical protein